MRQHDASLPHPDDYVVCTLCDSEFKARDAATGSEVPICKRCSPPPGRPPLRLY
jgi:hypothetical protein